MLKKKTTGDEQFEPLEQALRPLFGLTSEDRKAVHLTDGQLKAAVLGFTVLHELTLWATAVEVSDKGLTGGQALVDRKTGDRPTQHALSFGRSIVRAVRTRQ